MQQDTVDILADWGEDITITRENPENTTYDAEGRPTPHESTIATYSGDWQPVSGETMRVEAGRKVKSKAQVILPVTATDIQEGDKAYRNKGEATESHMYVNYVKVFEDHITVYLTDTEDDAGE
jgi:hypothetical protein